MFVCTHLYKHLHMQTVPYLYYSFTNNVTAQYPVYHQDSQHITSSPQILQNIIYLGSEVFLARDLNSGKNSSTLRLDKGNSNPTAKQTNDPSHSLSPKYPDCMLPVTCTSLF